MRLVVVCSFFCCCLFVKSFGASSTSSKNDIPPPFFLQDPSDSLCLGGETFKRCSIETLFYVVGNPGSYKIHKRPVDGVLSGADVESDGTKCLAKKSCDAVDAGTLMPLIVASCSHCGAKRWNILGDAETGYVLTEGADSDYDVEDEVDGDSRISKSKGTSKTCVFRKGNLAMTAPCDSTEVQYTPLQLRFTSPTDIKTMSSPGARMIAAASDGNLDEIKVLMRSVGSSGGGDGGVIDINVRDWDELTALIPAASGGHLEVCKYLVEHGIDVNAADKDGITALMEASIMGHPEIVTFLLQAGATVDLEASSEVTALWLAASEGQVECMKILLDAGASATNTRSDGISALMTAAVGGHHEAVRLLTDYGADPTTVDKEGLTPLMNAAENGTVAVLNVLIQATKSDPTYIEATSNSGFNALIIAAAHGHADAVQFLLSVGAQPDATKAENQVTALMFAAASNHVAVMKLLLESGSCSIDAKHSNGGTALLEASTGGAIEAIRLLIEKGASVDVVDDDGVTPLMAIASQGNITGVDVIIEALLNTFQNDTGKLQHFINLFSKSGGSTVMFATAGGHAEATKRLMALGADVHAIARATPDYLQKLQKMKAEGTSQEADEHVDGVTALHVAAQSGHLQVVQILIDAGVDVTIKDDAGRTPLLLAIKGNYGSVANALVNAGADPNTVYTDDEGAEHNLLFDAIMVENVPFAILLIEKGADIYYKDDKQVTTLLQASHRGLTDVVHALLKSHAASDKPGYLDDASDEGITPLIAASSEGHADVVKVLAQFKVALNAADQDKTTALMAAAARGHAKVVQVLLDAGASVNEQNIDGHTALMFAYNGKNQVETLWDRYVQYVEEAKTSTKVSNTKDIGMSNSGAMDDVDDSGTGPIIREALDNHLALVEMLHKAGADTTLVDKEGHTAKDFDYNPEIDSNTIAKAAKTTKIKDESKYEL